jgi:Ribonuclease HII
MPAKTHPRAEELLSPSAQKLRLLKRLRCTLKFEKLAWAAGAKLVAGVDEVGRGSLFGPVVAAAVVLDPNYRIRGLRDSKLLRAGRREVLAQRIREHAVAWAVAAVDAARIDQINIYHASRQAMVEAVSRLDPLPDHLLVDALKLECDLGPGFSPLWPGREQGLQHPEAPGRPARAWPLPAAPAILRTGLERARPAGDARIHAAGCRAGGRGGGGNGSRLDLAPAF